MSYPKCFEKIKVYGKYRQKNPPSVWKSIPKSQTPSIPPPMRTTKRASSSIRSRQEDEFDSFLEKDETTFEGLHAQLICSKSRDVCYTGYCVYCRWCTLYTITTILSWNPNVFSEHL